MCSWCYAFKPVLQKVRLQLPESIEFSSLLGGLAADTELAMPAEMRQQLQTTWKRIEQKVPKVQFNYDFWINWKQTHPRRATYPACRAVIAAHTFDNKSDKHTEYQNQEAMVDAIQKAYYQKALNPSDESVLIQLAGEIGLDTTLFQSQLQAEHTQLKLEKQIHKTQQMKVNSYPSLILKVDQSFWPVGIDYLEPDAIMETISMLIEFE